MNDEMFVTRFHWDPGNGQPAFREAVLDYFQDSTGTYNSTDATQLWNIQGFPYYQNKLPSNTIGRHDQLHPDHWDVQRAERNLHEVLDHLGNYLPLRGTVAVNGSAHTYTRSSGSWIADGVKVGGLASLRPVRP
jgi:hypothetical protein